MLLRCRFEHLSITHRFAPRLGRIRGRCRANTTDMSPDARITTPSRPAGISPNYKWLALSNTTIAVSLATIDSSIVLIALPNIFSGIDLNPLEPGNFFYLLWMILGFQIMSSVLVVSLGRLGDMFGRVRMYNLGFVVF